jgi:hypothetical protein
MVANGIYRIGKKREIIAQATRSFQVEDDIGEFGPGIFKFFGFAFFGKARPCEGIGG